MEFSNTHVFTENGVERSFVDVGEKGAEAGNLDFLHLAKRFGQGGFVFLDKCQFG